MVTVPKHFSRNYIVYLDSISKINKVWYLNIQKEINPLIKGKTILDIGNGGIFNFDISLPKKIIAIDPAFKYFFKLKKYSNVVYGFDDARSLKSIKRESVDVVLFQLVLHHVTGKSFNETINNLKQIFVETGRVLKPKREIVIVGSVVFKFLEEIEKIFYYPQIYFFKLFNKPTVFEFSEKTLLSLIQKGNFQLIKIKTIYYGKKLDVLNGIKPGLLIFPAFGCFRINVNFL